MSIDIKELPNNTEELHKIIYSLNNQLTEHKREIELLTEKNKILEYRLFGNKSEKSKSFNIGQLLLFNEAELAEDGHIVDEDKSKDNIVHIKGYTRRKKGRKPIPEHIPRIEIIHDLSEEEKKCKCCDKKRAIIGSDITEELSYVPAKFYVKKHIRYKYGSCNCEGSVEKKEDAVIIASMPERIIPGSIASPELLAYIIISKYADGLPLYRIEKKLKRNGIHIPRQSMSNWIVQVGNKVSDLIEIMQKEIRSGPLIQMDETTVQVLNEIDRPAASKSYMWVSLGYPEHKPIILYHYHPTRSKKVPLSLLDGYKGYLQTDGYTGYNDAGSLSEIIHVGCFSHARRKFDEVLKVQDNNKDARYALEQIKKLYFIDNSLREKLSSNEITADSFEQERLRLSNPVLIEMKSWLDKSVDEVAPSTMLGKAINYLLNEWSKIIRYLEKWYITPDNNRAENAIRPFVLGRKNWLFCNTPSGAHASAAIYSLVETAKANKLEPFRYIFHLLKKTPEINDDDKDELKKLLPTQLDPSDLTELDRT